MRGTGRLLQTWWDSRSRKTMIQFEVAGDVLPDCEKLGAKELDIRAYPVSKRRSLNANAYYWVLVGKMAEKLRISTARLHNLHLRECGYREMMGDQVVYVVIPDDQEEDSWSVRASTSRRRARSSGARTTDCTALTPCFAGAIRSIGRR